MEVIVAVGERYGKYIHFICPNVNCHEEISDKILINPFPYNKNVEYCPYCGTKVEFCKAEKDIKEHRYANMEALSKYDKIEE